MPKFYIIKYQRFKILSKNKVSKNWTVSVKKLDSECQKIGQLKKYFHIGLFDISKLLSLQIRNTTPNLSELSINERSGECLTYRN